MIDTLYYYQFEYITFVVLYDVFIFSQLLMFFVLFCARGSIICYLQVKYCLAFRNIKILRETDLFYHNELFKHLLHYLRQTYIKYYTLVILTFIFELINVLID